MGRASTINRETGEALFRAYQRIGTVAGAARDVGVSESAARRYLDAAPRAAAPVIAQQSAILESAGADLWDTRRALAGNFRRINHLIAQLEAGIIELREAADGSAYETRVSPAILVSALREGREHIEAALRLHQLLISVEETRAFQQAVIEAIGQADEPTRDRIITALRERRTLGLLVGGG